MSRTTAGFFVPFEQKFRNDKKGVPISNRGKSSSFCATSRDLWQQSHASKTNPPEVGKYKPRFSQVEKIAQQPHINVPKINYGAERIAERDNQKQHWCEHILKNINPNPHPGKRALGAPVIEQPTLEMGTLDKDDEKLQKSKTIESKGAEDTNFLSINFGADLERNLTSGKSQRRGDFQTYDQTQSPKDNKRSTHKTGAHASSVDYTTVFMPNGQSSQTKSLNKKYLKKYNVEHWAKYSGPSYETQLTLNNYHIVRDKGTTDYYIQENKVRTEISKNLN